MQIFSVEGNTQRLDGGAMFGNCPRAVWAGWAPPDDHNRIRLACRSMLVREDSGRNVLLETGIGAFFEPKMRDRFGVQEPEHVLLRPPRQQQTPPAWSKWRWESTMTSMSSGLTSRAASDRHARANLR